jgi:hypothetical protein
MARYFFGSEGLDGLHFKWPIGPGRAHMIGKIPQVDCQNQIGFGFDCRRQYVTVGWIGQGKSRYQVFVIFNQRVFIGEKRPS